ncbi:MAG: FapA family protein [Treponema sp.]|jgi:uncharacterized protein (DUF342 family)|nr:FapA family protein [Treponema sp.]
MAVDFVRLQHLIKERLERDRTIRTIEAAGPTLEAAVSEAATLLDAPIRRLEYEVLEKGYAGFLGSGKKNWKIRAYERVFAGKEAVRKDAGEDEEAEFVPVIEDKDGEAFVHLSPEGAFLKVVPPQGNGRRAAVEDAVKLLQTRDVTDIDRESVAQAINEMAGAYIKVGNFEHHSYNDSYVRVDIADEEMKAYMTVNPPGPGGCDISVETYLSYLHNNRVVYGIKEDFLREFADKPVYKEQILVAEGSKPVNGRDAYIQYNFETDQSKVRFKEGNNGRVDFKELNIIQNVVENQPLAKKIEAETGIVGKMVTGKIIPAKDGRDIVLPVGKNVHVSDDGSTIFADINGQVVVVSGKINVEPVTTIQGDVNLKTGNIIFLGTVIITGNVEDGFSVQAAGNIEVNGTVEKANLDAEGDIIVHQGITGKNTGAVKAGRSIWARFIENTIVESGNMVVVSDGIINSQVSAEKRIICQGKRAHIVGGHLRASEEINAKIIGSSTSGTETICEVGFNPRRKKELAELIEKKADIEKHLEDLQHNIQTLINIKKQRKSLPEDKEAYLQELMDKRDEMFGDRQKVNEDITSLNEQLNNITVRGRVSASSKVYPGVKVIIKDYISDVRGEYKAVTFILEDKLVKVTKYEEPDEEVKRGLDGYTTN